MAHVDQLENYFAATDKSERRIGVEIETFFVNDDGTAITLEQSQNILRRLTSLGWQIAEKKGDLVTCVKKGTSRVQYELGYPNLELSACPCPAKKAIACARLLLADLYRSAEETGAYPHFSPIFHGTGNFLVVPDKRDATWLQLDGEQALSPLAKTSAVQFTVDVHRDSCIKHLHNLWARAESFQKRYPQNKVWKTYIERSPAGYQEDRFGGSDDFDTLQQYCYLLSKHAVVQDGKLVPFSQADLSSDRNIELFLRSVWWYFRLRRYYRSLCIEVRPLPRRRDELLQQQLEEVLDTMG